MKSPVPGTCSKRRTSAAGSPRVSLTASISARNRKIGAIAMPGDAASATTSTINWDAPGKTLANGGTVKLDANRQVKVFCSDPAAISSTEFILDITGYYL